MTAMPRKLWTEILEPRIMLNGDANGDNLVDISDLAILRANLGKNDASLSDGDFNQDLRVDEIDFQLARENFGRSPKANAAITPPRVTITKNVSKTKIDPGEFARVIITVEGDERLQSVPVPTSVVIGP